MNGIGRDEKKEKKEKSRASVMTRETVGMTLLLFSAVIFFICVTGNYLFGEIGVAITAFFLGIFGFLTYPLLVYTMYQSFVLVFGKGKIPFSWRLRVWLVIAAAFLIVHTATAERFFGGGYGAYLAGCWSAAQEGAAGGTGGGVVLGAIVYPVRALLSPAGAYVVFALLVLLSLAWLLMKTPLRGVVKGIHSTKRKENKGGYDPNETFDDEESTPPKGFEDLTPTMHRIPPMQKPQQSYEQPKPSAPVAASMRTAQEQSVREMDKDRSREILFGSDPQEAYRNNLIFNRDSYFNSRERSSSMYDNLARGNGANGYSTYNARFATEAETPSASVPRRVESDRPAPTGGYPYLPTDDISYTQTPSYHAQPQQLDKKTQRDYYKNDVPFRADPATAPAPQEKQTGTYIPEPDLTKPAPAPQAAKPEEPKVDYNNPDSMRSLFSRSVGEDRTGLSREPKVDYNNPDSLRSLFSRSVGEDRTRLPSDSVPENDRSTRIERAFPKPELRDGRKEEKPLDDTRSFNRREETPLDDTRGFNRREETPLDDTRSFNRREETPLDDTRGFSRREETPLDDTRGLAGESRSSAASMFDDDDIEDSGDFRRDDTPPAPVPAPRTRTSTPREKEERIAPPSTEAAPAPKPKRHIYRQYIAPDYSLFKEHSDRVVVPQEEIERNSIAIEEALAGFKVDAKVVKVTCGATVTRYDMDIPGNVSVSTVTRHDDEIALRLRAPDGVNVYANRANGTVSVDVPNASPSIVGLRSLLYAPEFVNSKPGSLMFVIGKDVEGRPVIGNIVKMKQLLVAGTTGSGKSVTLHSMLISLICKYSPEDLRLILIDPKGEFTIYEGLPHLMINEIIADAQKAVTALNWAIKEMERRYQLFQQKTRSGTLARNIDEYNATLTPDEEKLCKIVIVVDELADLMAVAKKDIEERIQRLTQKSRAAGIHLVISTQRPSVDVITGVIKGNLPTRMALRVIQEVDSRTIIDETGAQKLLGNGDMLFKTEGMFNCVRVQGAFLSSKEVEQVIANVKQNNEAYFDDEVSDYINNVGQSSGAGGGDDEGGSDDVSEQYIRALGEVVKLGQASISFIQRRCGVGYNHAGKIVEWMESMGYVSPFDGKAKARTVLLTKEEYESKYGSLD